MTTLTLRIIDGTRGQRASNVGYETRKIIDGDWQLISQDKTGTDGCGAVADPADLESGGYFEVLFHFGAYFSEQEYPLPNIKFVDIVPLRFGIEANQASGEIVLTISPHGYTVIRT